MSQHSAATVTNSKNGEDDFKSSCALLSGHSDESNEVPWTDDRIRWDEVSNVSNDDADETTWRDPFQSEDSTEIFTRRYALAGPEPETRRVIEVQLQGYQAEADEIWKSTGLTLWRASDYLCEYLIAHPQMLWRNNRNILELGAGLGLVGIVAHRILRSSSASSSSSSGRNGQHHTNRVILTDGDTDTLRQLRANLARNNCPVVASAPQLECRQLLWGRETALQFLRELQEQQRQRQQLQSDTIDANMVHHSGTTFDLILASDIVYAASIVDPLWETIQVLLSKPTTPAAIHPTSNLDEKAATATAADHEPLPPPCFVLAFAHRRVPVTIDTVLEAAVRHGFTYQLVQQDPTGIFIYVFQWGGEQPAVQLLQHHSRTRNDRPADGEIELFF